jgi:hypothetical protein
LVAQQAKYQEFATVLVNPALLATTRQDRKIGQELAKHTMVSNSFLGMLEPVAPALYSSRV